MNRTGTLGHKIFFSYSCSYELISSTIGLSVVEIWVFKVSPYLVFGVHIYSVYNECLIVVWSKVTVERRGRKKGPSLMYWFQRSMESGDASNEEAPPCDPKSNNLMQKEQSKAISMIVDMETKDGVPSWSSPKNWLGTF